MEWNGFSIIFLAALLTSLVVQLWLSMRHISHVRRNRDQVPAAFADRIALEEHRKAADYTITRTRFGMIDKLFGLLFVIGWTFAGGIELLDQLWRMPGWSPITTGVGFLISAFFIMSLLDLPFSAYATFVIEQRFGFNRTTIATFLADLVKQALLLVLIGTPLGALIVWLLAYSGGLWWFYAWLVWVGFTILMMWAFPRFIAPLFNKFKALEDDALRERIQSLLKRNGFRNSGIFVMDGSKRSAHGNAYFTGLGNNKRIVFFDTLMDDLDSAEIEAVLAHELGHFKRRHVIKRLVLMSLLSLVGLAVLGWLIEQPGFYRGLGVATPSGHVALLLFLFIVPPFSFCLQPFLARLSRLHEFEADEFAAEQSSPRTLAQALVKLYRENAATLTPDPLYSAFHDSHPPAPVRIQRLERLAT
jgi:STE24 endopeptidase